MKKLFYLCAFALMGAVSLQAQEITFEEEIIDYGEIEKGADGNRFFKFTNTGDKPLQLKNVQTSCGCTASDWPKTPIKPGESAEIKVHYDTKRLNSFSKTLTVFSNAVESPRKILRIKGKVLQPAAAALEQ